jgi:protein farnesyltransferase subunit beta
MFYDEENHPTTTSYEQCSCERLCDSLLKQFYCVDEKSFHKWQDTGLLNAEREIRLLRSKHVQFLSSNLDRLPAGFVSIDSSRPWVIYWIVHSLYLLGKELSQGHKRRIISTLKHIQNPAGGYGGGPRQISQGAPNYAAVLSLCSIGSDEAFQSINRKTMYSWFLSLKQPNGGFSIHNDGETDSRSTYTIICIAKLLNILTPQLVQGTADFTLSCQTYEGGFGGEPFNEAHGGYNFCAMATLLILNDFSRCNLVNLENWLLNRQMKLEGGFQGRTNKLVDSCYSFWQGGALAILEIMKKNGTHLYDLEQFLQLSKIPNSASSSSKMLVDENNNNNNNLEDVVEETDQEGVILSATDFNGSLAFNQKALQKYILHCGQNFDQGGLRDKPGKTRDFYHCCYSLSGLSVSQRSIVNEIATEEEKIQRREKLSERIEQEEIENDGDLTKILPALDDGWMGPLVMNLFLLSVCLFV